MIITSIRNDIKDRCEKLSSSIDSNAIIHNLQKGIIILVISITISLLFILAISDRDSQIETYVEFIQRSEADINNCTNLKNQNEQLLGL
jgi:hypothetical protein